MRRLNYDDVIKTELQTKEKTDFYLKGVTKYEPIILNTFFQLMYFTGKKDVNNPEGNFHSYCWHQYYHSGYSLRACFILYEKGYYLEANILLRRLMEVLVKMRFLEKNKNLVGDIWMGKNVKAINSNGKSKKLTIKDMFNEVAPDLYEKFYGMLFSGFTHGGIVSSIGKIDHKTPNNSEAMLGSVWSEDSATFVINNLAFIALGYLIYFPKVFNEDYKKIDLELKNQYKKSVEWLRGFLDDHRTRYPNSEVWHKAIAPLVNV